MAIPRVNGDIYAGKLQVEPTAVFNGSCHMGANMVELKKEVRHRLQSSKKYLMNLSFKTVLPLVITFFSFD